ncbi:MAG: ABC-2 transporter permease [Lachnospiraceae bacterium]|nr:ABC-2 transporter permease [Lachnospiraceae bacterium]
MRGLLLKDWLVVIKQTKVYFVLMFVFALIPGMGVYSIFFGALLPMTAFAYDERSRWGQMAEMMPYSPRKVVEEKYMFGYLMAGGISVLEAVIQILYYLAGAGQGGLAENMAVILVSVMMALNVMALQMPVIFRIGVEKSRIFLMFVTISVMMALQSFFSRSVFETTVVLPEWSSFMLPGILVVTLVIQLLSRMLSVKFCTDKKK